LISGFILVALIGATIAAVALLAARPPAADAPALDIGAVIGDSFGILRRNWRTFIPLALLIEGAPELLGAFSGDRFLSPFTVQESFETIVIGYFFQAMLVGASIRSLERRSPELRESAWLALKRLLPIIAAAIVSWLCIIAGFALLVVPGFIVAAALAMVVPVMVAERTSVIDAVMRSREMTRGARARVLALLFMFAALMLIIEIPVSIAGGALGENIWLAGIAEAVGASLTATFLAALLASIYVHLRRARGENAHEELQEIFR